ncbi:RNA polymerase sigma factor SigM [Nocardioides marmoribigeumensis]|uniref:RNA polymerase sigma-70 factor (ECF subfamily) n=1 Tax=Nocardioides marmoribigeumensis TaxID=433649 RepID=A0ABU2BUL1_9ACTN|nr:RNA polymerase sigma factor SigM [Nocardioides marmoribigeumensis]MDR7362319.1 RNA polymerase sigma-70 factor (ECF subfamily) [Nocardioides marmoribigeumensis]
MATTGPGSAGPDDRDDRSLIAAHVAGDPDAFGVLFGRHRDRLWAVALRTTGDREEAADALQDAMVSAFRKAASYREDAAVTTWLHRVVVNACLDRLRRRKVRLAEALPDETHTTPEALREPRSHSPEARAELAERRHRVLAALATLPAEQRAAIVLVDLQGQSVEEAAAVLEVAPGTIKSRCSRGRTRLAPLLADLRADAPPGNPDPPPRVPSVSGSQAPAPGEGGPAPPALR